MLHTLVVVVVFVDAGLFVCFVSDLGLFFVLLLACACVYVCRLLWFFGGGRQSQVGQFEGVGWPNIFNKKTNNLFLHVVDDVIFFAAVSSVALQAW